MANTWREKEALMRSRMMADPSIQEMITSTKRLHRDGHEKLWWIAIVGFALILPWLASKAGGV